MKKVVMIGAVALMAVACNKNQRAVKKLDGTWNATSIKVSNEDGVTVDLIEADIYDEYIMTFDDCKLKDDEFCNLTTTFKEDGEEITFADVYRATDDGETLETKDDQSSSTINSIEIIELSKSDLKLKQEDDGTVTEMTLVKQ